MPESSFENMLGVKEEKEISLEEMAGVDSSFEDMIGVRSVSTELPTTKIPQVPSEYRPEFAGVSEFPPFAGTPGEGLQALARKTGVNLEPPKQIKSSVTGVLKDAAKEVGLEALASAELAMSLASGMLLYLPAKAYGLMALPFGRDVANIAEEEMSKLGYQPYTKKGKEAAELVGKGFEWFLSPARSVGEEVSKLSPRLGYLAEFGAEMAEFIMTGGIVKGVKAKFKPSLKQTFGLLRARRLMETESIAAKEKVISTIPDEVMQKAQQRVLETQKKQVELELAKMEENAIKNDLKLKGEKVDTIEKGIELPKDEARVAEPDVGKPSELPKETKRVVEEPKRVVEEAKEPREPVTDLDRDVGIAEVPELLEGEKSPFFQSPEEAGALRKMLEGRKSVSEDVELYTQKIINDVNLAYHAGDEVALGKARDTLSRLASEADEFRLDFIAGVDHHYWKETVSDAAAWSRDLRLISKQSETKFYSGLPIDEAMKFKKYVENIFEQRKKKKKPDTSMLDEFQRAIVDGAWKFSEYVDEARGIKKFRPIQAAKALNKEFKRNFVDRSGNIRLELLDKLGDEGYKVVQKMYLTKGASSIAADKLRQMQKEVYRGLSRNEKQTLDKVILAKRMIDIAGYKTGKEFKFPEGLKPTQSASYLDLFAQVEGISSRRINKILKKADAYFEWMKVPLKDMLDAELISKEEFDDLSIHRYRKIKLVDIFDKRYVSKLKGRRRTIYNSGVETLAKGRETDIYEPSSEIMALEVFNRAYGRILNNEANKALLDVARSDPANPFVRYKETGKVPSGWQRVFVYEGGKRKAIYLSPDMAKEWITNNPEISYKMGQFLRYVSGSPVLRTFATGINWGFALANLPRDVMHTYFAARIFDKGKWRSVYSPHLPLFAPQISVDLARIFSESISRGKRYQRYIDSGGGMEFLVHQGSILKRGRRLENPLDKIQNFMGYFGETSEIMTRLAIRERVIRRRAKEKGLTFEQARENKDIAREATFAARDYMDFGQGGTKTKAADNALPYLNAAVQGTRGLWRAAVDNPIEFSYKVAQIGAATTLIYSAMRNHAPKTTSELQGNIDMQNNICIPWGDDAGFEDEKGQMRYPYWKIPLDPSQKFFKSFFEAAYDKSEGYEVDIDRVTNNLLEQSPVGVSNLPPSLSATLGYIQNRDYWLNEDIWKKTEKPFSWPKSKEEYIPGKTPEFFVDVGKYTGLSPERTRYAVGEIFTSGTLWSYLMGEGYDKLFAEVPKEQREQHLAMVLSETPVVRRFIGVTNPYSKHAKRIETLAEDVAIDRWKERRELDRLTEGYLFEKSVERSKVMRYIRSFKDPRARERLRERFDFQYAIRNLPERSFWLRLQHLDPEVRAKKYYEEMKKPEMQGVLRKGKRVILGAGGFFSDTFYDELNKLRREGK